MVKILLQAWYPSANFVEEIKYQMIAVFCKQNVIIIMKLII